MRKKGVVFSDVDGTLCFHQEAHHIREIEIFADGTVVAEDPSTHKTHHAYDVSISSYNNIYLALETRQLGHKVRENYDFVYVTGGRPSTIFSRTRYFDFADAVIRFKDSRQPDPVFDFPGIQEGVRGMLFLEKVVESSSGSKKWVDL